MAKKKQETVSFVLRFTQKLFQSDDGENQLQWRGKVRHVQDGDEKGFAEFEEALQFIQHKLANLTISNIEDKSPEEQQGILSKSISFWKQMATETPKIILDSIKDPKGKVEQIQEQVQEQVHQVGDMIQSKIQLDALKPHWEVHGSYR